MKTIIAALSAGLFALATASAQTTNVSNLTSGDGGSLRIRDSVLYAGAFTTGPSDSILTSASISVGPIYNDNVRSLVVFSPGSGSSGHQPNGSDANYDAYIYSNSGLAPGSQLYNLGSQFVPFTPELLTFTAPGGATLLANTTYWLAIDLMNPPSGWVGGWSSTDTNSFSSPNGWTILDGSNLGGSVSTITPLFSLQASPVPEPASLALAGVGSLALLAVRRKKE